MESMHLKAETRCAKKQKSDAQRTLLWSPKPDSPADNALFIQGVERYKLTRFLLLAFECMCKTKSVQKVFG